MFRLCIVYVFVCIFASVMCLLFILYIYISISRKTHWSSVRGGRPTAALVELITVQHLANKLNTHWSQAGGRRPPFSHPLLIFRLPITRECIITDRVWQQKRQTTLRKATDLFHLHEYVDLFCFLMFSNLISLEWVTCEISRITEQSRLTWRAFISKHEIADRWATKCQAPTKDLFSPRPAFGGPKILVYICGMYLLCIIYICFMYFYASCMYRLWMFYNCFRNCM